MAILLAGDLAVRLYGWRKHGPERNSRPFSRKQLYRDRMARLVDRLGCRCKDNRDYYCFRHFYPPLFSVDCRWVTDFCSAIPLGSERSRLRTPLL